MARIKIKSLGWIDGLTKEQGQTVLKKFASLKEQGERLNNHPLLLPDWGGTYADIDQIDLVDMRYQDDKAAAYEDKRKQENQAHYASVTQEFRDYQKSLMAQSPEKRGENLSVAKMVWFAATAEKDIPAEVKADIITRQQEYLKENPNRMYANPICYQDIIRKHVAGDSISTGVAESHVYRAATRLVGNVISNSRTA